MRGGRTTKVTIMRYSARWALRNRSAVALWRLLNFNISVTVSVTAHYCLRPFRQVGDVTWRPTGPLPTHGVLHTPVVFIQRLA